MNRMESKTKYRNCPICNHNTVIHQYIVDNIDIVRCCNCRMVFADLDANVIYESNKCGDLVLEYYYENEPVYTMAYYDFMIKKMIKLLKRKDFKVLDFGCGSGMFLRRCRKFGIDAYGLDYSPYSKLAKELFDLKIVTQDIKNCNFIDQQFDIIISHATFEHLTNPVQMAQDLLPFLKKGGIFIISGVPNFNTFTIKILHSFYHNSPPGHVNYFECSSMRELYKLLNLEVLFLKTYGMDIWYIKNWLDTFLRKTSNNAAKTTSSWQQAVNDNYMMKNYEKIEPTVLQKVIAKIYLDFAFQGIGQSIEVWGVKR